MAILSFVLGLAALVVGAEALVRGASRIAAALGIPPLVVGLTVVAFGTSAPELAVSIGATLSGQPGIALGNVVGSNIFNVLFILGISALIVPLGVSRQLVRLDVPLMIALSVLVLLFALDGRVGRIDGLVLVVGLLVYVVLLVRHGRRTLVAPVEPGDAGQIDESASPRRSRRGMTSDALLIAGGLGLLVLGSRWLVAGAVAFAQYLGFSELVIGLTVVAAGTSLPEVVTSIVAAVRGERDIAVGNVVGSNIFNIMGVLGFSSLVAPSGIEISPAMLGFDIPLMILVAFACLPIFFTGSVISRAEGALLLLYYFAYTTYLVLASTQHDALPRLNTIMLGFAIPLTLVTLIVLAARDWHGGRSSRSP